MAEIRILDKHTAELIAAGEVVERPASVVKELLENAIDAGATQITVTIESGGIRFIEISDNGTGIEPQYIGTAFIRHATSKVRTQDDLNNIATLGFRGEALASIASVSRVEVLTKTADADFALCYHIEGGEELDAAPAARAVGTTMRVRDLFYNTPARMKFLKKDASEGTFAADVIGHVALSHPEISVKFIREGKLQYVTPGDGDLMGAAYAVLGREFARPLVPVEASTGLYRVYGYVTPPKNCRASRSMQYFYINGRYVRNRTMMAALETAFKGTLMHGKFPGCVLCMDMPVGLIDVNVHPAKTEVRFAYEKEVFNAVYYAVKSALTPPSTSEQFLTFAPRAQAQSIPVPVQSNAGAHTAAEQSSEDALEVRSDAAFNAEIERNSADYPCAEPVETAKTATSGVNRGTGAGITSDIFSGTGDVASAHADSPAQTEKNYIEIPADAPIGRVTQLGSGFAQAAKPSFAATRVPDTCLDISPEHEAIRTGAAPSDAQAKPENAASGNSGTATPPEEASEAACVADCEGESTAQLAMQPCTPEQTSLLPEGCEEPLRYVGEAFKTYIITQRGESLCLIDKHAAHERILYEVLVQNYGAVASQMLLEAVVVNLSAAEKQALLDENAMLEDAGFTVEDFGGASVLVRAVPADIEQHDIENLVVELAAKLATGARDALSEKTQWVLHSIACRAAIKAGDTSDAQQLIHLAQRILSGEVPPFCPHGRPCIITLTRKELEKQFGRIV